MILATTRTKFSGKKFEEALRILKSMSEQCSLQPGCLSSRVYRSEEEDNTLMFEQQWSNEEDMKHYLRSEDCRQLLVVLEMAVKQPEIRFDTILSSAGIETIEKARSPIER